MGKNIFNTIELTKPGKNMFDLTHDVKLSCKMGDLIPVMVQECIPGDKFMIGAESLIRFAPLIAPVMHRMDVSIHYFFVPNRILWPNWEEFITQQYSETSPVAPYATVSSFDLSAGQIKFLDYLGIPPLEAAAGYWNVNALPLAAYQAIYNEYYRDQNLVAEVDYELPDGQIDGVTNPQFFVLRKRAWEHDYFTSALPFAQKGNPVSIPLGDVVLKSPTTDLTGQFILPSTGAIPAGSGALIRQDGAAGTGDLVFDGTANLALYDPNGSLEVGSTTITDLRRAFRLQEWLEKNARGGTRYTENILAHFGVRSSDARLQRPEYITGVRTPVVISEILNTTGEVDGLPQGNMAGHGVSVAAGRFGSYFCEEHGWIIGILNIQPKTAYQQGFQRHWFKLNPLDYYWPSFAHIGEQAVYKGEIYADDITQAVGLQTFGYVPRYAEYKFTPNRVAGDFRTTLNFWHLGRIFDNVPALNQAFIECDPTTRIFAVEDGTDYLWCHVLNKVKAIRPMPKFGNPYM